MGGKYCVKKQWYRMPFLFWKNGNRTTLLEYGKSGFGLGLAPHKKWDIDAT
jgi:hypothetical protein